MPNIGGVHIPDELMPTVQAPERPRPGFGDLLGSAAKSAYAQLRYGLPLQFKTLTDSLEPGDAEFYEQGLNEAARGGSAPASAGDVFSGKVGPLRAVAENLVYSLPYMAGAAAGGTAGFFAGGPAGAVAGGIAGGVPQFSAMNVDRAVQEQGELTRGAAERSLAVAPLQSAADIAIARFLPGAGKVLGGLAAHQEGNFIRRVAASAARGGATEAVTEAGQQVGERFAAGLPVDSADAAKEYASAAAIAFGVGGLLGAGGGFRRTSAAAKPSESVTDDDLLEHVDEVLSGRATAATAISQVQSELALEGGSAVEQQPELLATEPEAAETPASRQLPQLPGLHPALSTVPEGTQLELGQTFEDNLTPRDLPTEGGVQVSPELEALIQQTAAPAPSPLTASTILSRGALDTPVEPEVVAPPRRIFGTEPIEDLETALKAKGTDPAVVEEAQREIEARRAEALGSEPLTAENYQQRVDEMKRGLRGGFVQSVEARTPQELLEKVHEQIFDNADTRSNTAKFAQRLGLLDADLQETPLAQQVAADRVAKEGVRAQEVTVAPETRRAANTAANQLLSRDTAELTTAVEPEFAGEWSKIKQDAGIKRLRSGKELATPPNLASAQAQVFQALATDSSDAEVSQIEKLARKMGLITDDDAMDVTPLGRQTFLRTPEGQEEVVRAAQLQGHTGVAASQFDRGVKAQLSGGPDTLEGDFSDLAAYQAGKVWAEDFTRNGGGVRTAAQTQAIQGRLSARQTGRAVARGSEPTRRELQPEQVQQASLNRLLDVADLRAVPDSDVAALRRMIRDGAPAEEIGQALQQVQGGKTLFKQPPSTRPQPAGAVARGQPVFKELNTPQEVSKVSRRVETEVALLAADLRRLVQMATDEGAITARRAEKLNTLLDQGKVQQVQQLMKDFDPGPDATAAFGERRTSSGRRMEPRSDDQLGFADAQLEQAVTGKTFMEALDVMVEVSPSIYHRQLMKNVRSLAEKLEKLGTKFNLHIVKDGDAAPSEMVQNAGTRAFAVMWKVPPRVDVTVKSVEMGPEAGMNYQVLAHEMVHAVTLMLTNHYRGRAIAANDKLGEAVKNLDALAEAVVEHFQSRLEQGQLNEFETKFHNGTTNSLLDPDEVLAWGLTNSDMQRYLATIQYKPRQSVWSRLVELLRKVFATGPAPLVVTHDSALAELLRVAERISSASQAELAPVFMRNRFENAQGRLSASMVDAGASAANRTAQAANDTTQQMAAMLEDAVTKINPQELNRKGRRAVFGWLTRNQLDRLYGRLFPGMVRQSDAHRERVAVRSRFEQMGDEVYQSFERLERENPKSADRVNELMRLTAEFQLDPDKPWEQHEHLKNNKNVARLQELHKEVVGLKNDLSRGDARGIAVFNNFRLLNEAQNYARMAAGMHSHIAMDPELALGVEGSLRNPVDAFMRAEGMTTPLAIRDRWRQLLQEQLMAVTEFVTLKKGEAAQGTQSDQNAMQQHLSPIEMQVNSIMEAQAAMQKAPYFHLGRFGDNFVAFEVRKNQDGTVDQKALLHVAEQLEQAGYRDAQISPDNTKPQVMMRLDTVDATQTLKALALELERQGWVTQGSTKGGPRARGNNYGAQDGMPEYVSRYIQTLEASPMYVPDEGMSVDERAALEKQKESAIQLAVDAWLDQQPDSSISKVLTKRYTVSGYHKDMVRNFAHRWRVGAINVANTSATPKFYQAYTEMRAQVNEAVEGEGTGDAFLRLDLMNELRRRDVANPLQESADTWDKLRAYGHGYFLGMSPAYGLINLTQLGVVALPELAKKHGFAKSFHAMRRASNQAFAIMRAVASESATLGPKHFADVTVTENVLKKAGLDKSTREFMRHMLATGTIDIGSAARALGQVEENRIGSRRDVVLRYASGVGMYTETFTRLTTALAARDLHGGSGQNVEKYATKVVSNSMFDYQTWNTARQLGKQGFAGPVTPLLMQFMSYTVQVTEKIYSEIMDAARKQRPGETMQEAATRKAEARRFLMGHLVAVTTLAGTLGMPFASVFATVIERLVDAFDDDEEPFDATASWRNFLADTLGEDMAEVVARGLPRALGFDISQRAGEADLLPFSQFLGDRRSWRESIEGMLGRSIGASPNMLLSVAEGGEKFAQGDVLGGLKTALPVAFKGPAEVYRMTSDGYVDTRGNKLPLSPDASAYLWQLIGFAPSEKAEYSEARGDQMARRGDIARKASTLRQKIMRAMISGEQDKARELIGEALEFDRDNPAFAVVPGLQGALQRQMQQRTRAAALGAPLGVSQRDVAGQALTQYANVDYTQ